MDLWHEGMNLVLLIAGYCVILGLTFVVCEIITRILVWFRREIAHYKWALKRWAKEFESR